MLNIHFILVRPFVPENIGFSARAIKTMGFNSLRIVKSKKHLEEKALKTAYQSHDVLKTADTYDFLKEALHDIDFAIGTTAKQRTQRKDYIDSKQLLSLIKKKESLVSSIAIVFGSEESGLTNEELNLCDMLSIIPMATTYPSLNLSHSLMIYAYELSGLSMHNSPKNTPTKHEQKELKEETITLLERLDVKRQPVLYRRILDKVMLANEEDTRLMLSLNKYLKNVLSKT